MKFAKSINGVPVRLTDERWSHIVEFHDELIDREDDVLETVSKPAWITRGYGGSLIAWKPFGRGKFLSVIYKEISFGDGFIVTAFFTRKAKKENKVWP